MEPERPIPADDATAWRSPGERPPLGRVAEIRLRSGATHFAQWNEGRREWVSTRAPVPAADVEAWRLAPRLV